MATRGPSGEIIPDHQPAEYWIAVDRDRNALSAKQAEELIRCARSSGDPSLAEFVPMLVDAYCRLHRLGSYAENSQPAPSPTEKA